MFGRFVRYYSLKNRLGDSVNPYLASHAQNPVAWQQWNRETLELAKSRNVPVFLSIGYHSCHWCHVMNHESFSNPKISEVLNSKFTPIKIDKEEWPDLDSIYMMYLQATNGSGGWPLNVFLTPDKLQPFFGGTYWAGPDVDPGVIKSLRAVPFLEILNSVSHQWETNREVCESSAEKIATRLAQIVDSKSSEPPVELDFPKLVETAEERLLSIYDDKYGGFGQAPKFPLPATLIFGLHTDGELKNACLQTLSAIFKGGIKDQVGNGVSRYSVTPDWHLPHFEKMLYDQGLLLLATLKAENSDFANDLTDFLVKGPLRSSQGGWFSAIDADSLDDADESHEGQYYLWTAAEIENALKDRPQFDADIVSTYYGVNSNGNINHDLDPHGEFYGKNVLSVYKTPEEVAATFGKSPEKVREIVAECRALLLNYRKENRSPPNVDTKIVTGWSGLCMGALARASWQLDRRDALTAAIEAADFLKENNWDGQNLMRTATGNIPAVNEDYAYVISGVLHLYEATFNIKYLLWANELQKIQIENFWDPRGGFYGSQAWPWLLYRPKSAFDSAEPSSNGVSLQNLARLGLMTQNSDYLHKAQHLIDCYSADINTQPSGYLSILTGMFKLNDPKCVALVGDDEQRASELFEEVRNLQKNGTTVIRVNQDSIYTFSELEKLWVDSNETKLVSVDV